MAVSGSLRLSGRRILVVEDDFFIAEDVAESFRERGAEVLGPVGRVADALALLRSGGRVDAAVLDLNLGSEMAYPIADELRAMGVPFVFATGYDAGSILPAYATVRRLEKPIDPAKVAAMLFG